jgi:8-oxo-dGTP diphosphatase
MNNDMFKKSDLRITVRVMVLNAAGNVLVMKRSLDDENVPGRVDFPGGGLEPDETCEAAIERELLEEAGLHVEESGLSLCYAFTRFEGNTNVIRQLYVTKISDQQVQLSFEHSTYAWLSLDEAEKEFADISWSEAISYVREHMIIT